MNGSRNRKANVNEHHLSRIRVSLVVHRSERVVRVPERVGPSGEDRDSWWTSKETYKLSSEKCLVAKNCWPRDERYRVAKINRTLGQQGDKKLSLVQTYIRMKKLENFPWY